MTISLRAAGTATAAAVAVTAVNPAVPTGALPADLSVLTVWMKPFGTTITTPSGWTKIAEHTNGTTAAGTDTGSTKVAVFVRVGAAVGAIGNITFGGSPNSVGAVINTYQNGTGLWDYNAFVTAADIVNGANYTALSASNLVVAAGDWVCQSTAVNGDVGTQSGQTMALTGATLGTYVVRQSADTTTGTDSHGEVGDIPVTVGANGTVQFQYTNASSGSGSTIFLRLREVASPPPASAPVIHAHSGYASATAEATASLTLPTWTWQANDWIVVFAESSAGSSTPTAEPHNNGQGYTFVGRKRNNSGNTLGMYVKQAVAGDVGSVVSVTYGTTQIQAISAIVVRNTAGLGASVFNPAADSSDPVTLTATLASFTPTNTIESLIVGVISGRRTGTASTATTPTGYTEVRTDLTTNGTATNLTLKVVTDIDGVYTSPTASADSTLGNSCYVVTIHFEMLEVTTPPVAVTDYWGAAA